MPKITNKDLNINLTIYTNYTSVTQNSNKLIDFNIIMNNIHKHDILNYIVKLQKYTRGRLTTTFFNVEHESYYFKTGICLYSNYTDEKQEIYYRRIEVESVVLYWY